jgi:hypothetical protein
MSIGSQSTDTCLDVYPRRLVQLESHILESSYRHVRVIFASLDRDSGRDARTRISINCQLQADPM